MAKMLIRRESAPYIVLLAVITVIIYISFSVPAIISCFLLLFISFFLSDPERFIIHTPKTFFSPADGAVMKVPEIIMGKVTHAACRILCRCKKGNFVRNGITRTGVVK